MSTMRYTKDHEWIRVEGNVATIGITDFAQEELGDIVFVELPNVGDTLQRGKTLGVVESVKAVSDVYAPVGGTVKEVNAALDEHPEVINEDCYGKGWMVKVTLADANEVDALMTAEQYEAFLAKERA